MNIFASITIDFMFREIVWNRWILSPINSEGKSWWDGKSLCHYQSGESPSRQEALIPGLYAGWITRTHEFWLDYWIPVSTCTFMLISYSPHPYISVNMQHAHSTLNNMVYLLYCFFPPNLGKFNIYFKGQTMPPLSHEACLATPCFPVSSCFSYIIRCS